MSIIKMNLQVWCEQNNRIDLLDDWDFVVNGSPSDYGYASSKDVSWICHRCGHQWTTRVSARTKQGNGCKKCSRRNNTSFPEQAIYFYVHQYFSDAINGDWSVLSKRELDIYIPSLNVAIEYDGQNWHENIQKDIDKDILCKEKNIILYRVRENDENIDMFTESIVFVYDFQNWKELDNVISLILKDFGVTNPDVDIVRDTMRIKESFFNDLGDKSLLSLYPDIAKEWDFNKNGLLKPSMISPNDHDEYWWVCSVCHKSYKAIVKNRTRVGSGCYDCGAVVGGKKQMTRVRNVTTGQIFDNLTDAANSVGVSKAAIVKACQGLNKTCKSFVWEYVDRDSGHRPKRLKQPTQRAVQNIDTGQIYESLADALAETKIVNISAVCRGLRKTAGGYHWKYVDSE